MALRAIIDKTILSANVDLGQCPRKNDISHRLIISIFIYCPSCQPLSGIQATFRSTLGSALHVAYPINPLISFILSILGLEHQIMNHNRDTNTPIHELIALSSDSLFDYLIDVNQGPGPAMQT